MLAAGVFLQMLDHVQVGLLGEEDIVVAGLTFLAAAAVQRKAAEAAEVRGPHAFAPLHYVLCFGPLCFKLDSSTAAHPPTSRPRRGPGSLSGVPRSGRSAREHDFSRPEYRKN